MAFRCGRVTFGTYSSDSRAPSEHLPKCVGIAFESDLVRSSYRGMAFEYGPLVFQDERVTSEFANETSERPVVISDRF